MARDFDAELARAMEKVERIKKAKEDALRRKREPIGKVMLEFFPDLEACGTEKEIKAFLDAHIKVIENDEQEETAYEVSDDDMVGDNFAGNGSFEK